MSSVADKGSTRGPRRVHDAQASRQALLQAATELFDARGYEATTVRAIGEQAAVDPALIARYFGGKEGLYLATVEQADRPPATTDPLELLDRMLRHGEVHGLGPIGLAMVSPTLSDAVRDRVRDVLAARATGPVAAALAQRGVADGDLRAQVLVAIALGLSLTRGGGTLPDLAAVELDDLVALMAPAVDALCA